MAEELKTSIQVDETGVAAANENPKRMVVVLAHPDDETFGMGGTLAYYARSGAHITLICTTHGEAGDVDPKYLEEHATIAELRTAELRCAAEKLGIQEVFQLAYHDSGMQGTPSNCHPQALINASIDAVACEIAAHLRRVRPQVVVTHDPVGNYFHPDHIATHEATTMAFFLASDSSFTCEEDLPPWQPEYLYFYTMHRKRLRWLLWVMPLLGMNPKRYGRNKDIDMERVLKADIPVHVEVNFQDMDLVREEASRCHASQGGGSRSLTLFGRIRRWLASSKDAYMQAYPEVRGSNGRLHHDLFDHRV